MEGSGESERRGMMTMPANTKKRLPKGVKLIERLSVIRLCGHVEQLTGPVCRYSYAQLTKLTVTPCNDCKGEYRDDN
jgi:hypothetical protein